MKKKLYLHIGTAKTATTTLQLALSRNRKKLSGLGYRYAGFSTNHSNLLNLMFSDHPHDDPNLITKGINTKKKCKQTKSRWADRLAKEFSSPEDNFIFSGEKLSSFTANEASHIRSYMMKYFKEIKIIVYVRDPVGYANSIAQQRLKHKAVLENFDTKPPLPFYKKKIAPYIDAFGSENVIIRVFNEAIRSDFGIVGDFLEVIGIASSRAQDFETGTPANSSLSMESALIISAVNKVRPLIRNNKINKGRCRQDANKIFGNIPGARFSLSKETLTKAILRSKDDHDWLRKTMGREPFSELPNIQTSHPAWNEGFLQAIGELIFELHSSNQEMRRELSKYIREGN
jgi:hypothetical protein